MKIADTHTHLYFESFDKDRDLVIQQNRAAGVDLQVQIGCDEISSLAALELAKNHEDMYCTLGLHPVDVWDFLQGSDPRRYPGFEDYIPQAKTFEAFGLWMEQQYLQNKEHVVGFGETGIDLYHQNFDGLLEAQIESFLIHLKLCQKHGKTLVIHSRNAGKETLEFLKKHYKTGLHPTIFHCFSEDAEYAKILVEKYDMFIGIGGASTYNNAETIREAIAAVPLEKIVTETDAPFLVPHQYRKEKKRNESRFIREIIENISIIKKQDIPQTAQTLFQNAKNAYLIEQKNH